MLVAPDADFTDGPMCGGLAAEYGLKPDPWQQLVLDNWLACEDDHTYSSDTCGLSVPRQNGKNAILEMVELFKLCVQHRKVLHTAHEVKTCRKAFLRLKSFFEQPEQYPELAGMVKYIRSANGQEAIQLFRLNDAGDKVDGGSIEFIARSKSSGRGFTVDDVVCDEAQEMTDEQFEVLRSTNSAAPSGNPQFIMTGTPTPPSSPGTVFARTRDNVMAGSTKQTCWIEWSVDEIGDVRDMGRVEDTNPALGFRLQPSVIDGEVNSMEPDGFARERLGWWAERGAGTVIGKEAWDCCRITEDDVPKAPECKVAFGVKFSTDGATVAVCGARVPAGGVPHIELVHHAKVDRGVRWLAEWIDNRRETTAAVAIDGMGGSSVLVEKLEGARYPRRAILLPSANGVVAAATMLLDAVNEHAMTHKGQQALTESALSSTRRDIGSKGGWGFDGEQCLPVEAASLALWAVKETKRDPNRKVKLL